MELTIKIPDKIAKIFKENPGIGRRKLKKITGISISRSTYYCTLWSSQFKEEELDDIEIRKTKEITDKTRINKKFQKDKADLEINSLFWEIINSFKISLMVSFLY